ncbi:hypothetical protein M3Y97_00624400 [Aphelenchoides bicaudatus]|nr:hypothetical protein M3Y97_00624400 [Aphelenchoides bicaudatus]
MQTLHTYLTNSTRWSSFTIYKYKMGQYLSSYFYGTSTVTRPPVTHVIFDFDGIMIDSEIQYSKAMKLCLEPHGKEFTLDQKLKIMGRKKPEAIQCLIDFNDLSDKITLDEMLETYNGYLEDVLLDCPVLPGVQKLVSHLQSHNIPMAICTGSDAEEFEQKTRKNLQHWLQVIPNRVLAGSDPDVKEGKPAPDPYLCTFKRFTKQPESHANCIVFEDSINGAKAALEANMECILIPQAEFMCEETEKAIEELRPRLADVLKSMEDFNPEHYSLPAFN